MDMEWILTEVLLRLAALALAALACSIWKWYREA